MFHILFALVLLPLGALHFLPTIAAALRHSRHLFAIFVLNLLFGWTVIGWILAMVWAVTSEPKWAASRWRQPVYAPSWTGYRRF